MRIHAPVFIWKLSEHLQSAYSLPEYLRIRGGVGMASLASQPAISRPSAQKVSAFWG